MPKTALYVRVSTSDQTVENQIEVARGLAVARGYTDCEVYPEVESAAKKRPVYDRMLADVRAGRVGCVCVVALDRLHRSMRGAIDTVLELDRLGVRLLSVREPWLDTSGPIRPLLVAIFGWVAEQEREILISRVNAGIARARKHGTKSGRPMGRPPASPVLVSAAVDLVRSGVSVSEAARRKGLARSSVRRAMAAPAPAARAQ